MKSNVKVCSRCVMEATDPDISFDSNGVCNYCTDYFRRAPGIVFEGDEGQRRLDAIIEKIKAEGVGREYDCIMGISGGVDSTYVAYQAKKLGLRPLAVHFDNGWNSELAVSNIEGILNKLGIDLYTYVVDWEEFKDLQLSFLRASVANCEIPTDHGFLAVLYRIAAQKGIKYFLTGTNFVTEGILPAGYGYLSVDLRQILAIHRKFGSVPLKTYPTISLPRYFYHRFAKSIVKVSMLNYIRYHKDEAMEVIQNELGWKYYGGKHYESIYTRFFQSYILPNKFKIDKRKAHLSSLICSGQITRDEALAELSQPPCDPKLMADDKEYVLKKLGLSTEEFGKIMSAPIKSHRDYANNERIFKLLTWLNERRNGRRAQQVAAVVNMAPTDDRSGDKIRRAA